MTDVNKGSAKAARLWLSSALALAAVTAAGAAQAKVDFSGYWTLKTDLKSVPRADATPAARKTVETLLAGKGYNAPKGSPEYARQFCTVQGMPWQTTYHQPIDVRQGPLTVSMVFPVAADPRHIYIDGQKQVDLEEFDRTSNGHSVGHWEGNVLVAKTIGFGDQGVLLIPGGGLRSENSQLTERYQLVNPNLMRVTYTWTDKTTLRKPHTYVFEFQRAKGPIWMNEPPCSPIRAMRQKGLYLPPGAPQE